MFKTMNRIKGRSDRAALNEANYDPHTAQRAQSIRRLTQSVRPQGKGSSAPQRLESLRTSPYMFFHGETAEYAEAARERDEQRLAWMDRNGVPRTTLAEDNGSFASSPNNQSPPPAARASSPTRDLPPAPSPALVDSIFDDLNTDAFSAGNVLLAAERCQVRQLRKTATVKAAPAFQPTARFKPNMRLVRAALLRCAALEETSVAQAKPTGAGWSFNNTNVAQENAPQQLLLSVALLKSEFRDNLEVSSDRLLDLFARGVEGRPQARPGVPETLEFESVYEALDLFVNGKERMENTARSCFALFDELRGGTIKLTSLRALRGKPNHALPAGVTLPMLKGMMGLCLADPLHPLDTVTFDEFFAAFKADENLVLAFVEEIIRVVLVKHYEHDRHALMRLGS